MISLTVPPIVSIVGPSGVGKTTLLEKLIPALTGQGFGVGTVKHDVHGFEIDRPGKDSYRHKHAGARVSMISSPNQIGMVMDVDHDYQLDELQKFFSTMDIVLTEGYKKQERPKVEVFRPEVHGDLLCKGDDKLLALVSDVAIDAGVPRFTLDDCRGLADFLIARFKLVPGSKGMAL
ncbi:MAG: molybdopterin-guanine dinucleotide biosynthesis protein B [Desulfobacteraceae bacterium]|nr:molybdopterin-guanine dinucleotide biosynthesis protein B [Desulfobacteraceae bacterium]